MYIYVPSLTSSSQRSNLKMGGESLRGSQLMGIHTYNMYNEKKKKNSKFFFFFFFFSFRGYGYRCQFWLERALKEKRKRKKVKSRYIDYQYRFKNEASERKSWNSVYEFIF